MTTTQAPAVNARILARWGVERNGTTTLLPSAKPVRAILRDAGLEQHVQRIGSGRNNCVVWLNFTDEAEAARDAIVAALTPYWADGATRIYPSVTAVWIDRDAYYRNGIPTPVQGA
jgi:hypothetical protein